MPHRPLNYRLADVFAERSYEGNGVSVFVDPPELSTSALQTVTVELRQFESAFLWSTGDPTSFKMRIFAVDQELPFAGHPVLGAAATLHERQLRIEPDAVNVSGSQWTLRLGIRDVKVTSRHLNGGTYTATMDQGRPTFSSAVPATLRARIADALNLREAHLRHDLPMMWVSTGLRYLIVPVNPDGLESARIVTTDFDVLLAEAGAQFAYVLDVDQVEGRNWVNDGSVEDIATGSAAGPVAAYLVSHGVTDPNETVVVRQGRFLNRPSTMSVEVTSSQNEVSQILLTGKICMTGSGTLDRAPA